MEKTQLLYQGKWQKLEQVKFANKAGEEEVWEYSSRVSNEDVSAADGVDVISVYQRKLVVVAVFRYPVGKYVLEFPAGLSDHRGADPIETALRELKEEAGYTAHAEDVLFVSPSLQVDPWKSTESMKQVIVQIPESPVNEVPAQDLDSAESISVHLIEFVNLLENLRALASEKDFEIDSRVYLFCLGLTEKPLNYLDRVVNMEPKEPDLTHEEEAKETQVHRKLQANHDAMLANPNFPLTAAGRTMHLNAGPGDIANRIITVGDVSRAERISHLFDDPENTLVIRSERLMVAYTNTFRGVPVTVIATGMGVSMMDFMVRESTYFLKGNVAIVRLGTCGILRPEIAPGTLILSKASRLIQQNYDYDPHNPTDEPYIISGKVLPDSELYQILRKKLRTVLTTPKVAEGINLTGETFYNSQGRIDKRFEDYNEELIRSMADREPEAATLEMETFKLLHLASKSRGRVRACGCVIGLINRITEDIVAYPVVKDMEIFSAYAILQALIEYNLN